jgi:hypothetical protein
MELKLRSRCLDLARVDHRRPMSSCSLVACHRFDRLFFYRNKRELVKIQICLAENQNYRHSCVFVVIGAADGCATSPILPSEISSVTRNLSNSALRSRIEANCAYIRLSVSVADEQLSIIKSSSVCGFFFFKIIEEKNYSNHSHSEVSLLNDSARIE